MKALSITSGDSSTAAPSPASTPDRDDASSVQQQQKLQQLRELEIEMGLLSQRTADQLDRETRLPKLRLDVIESPKVVKFLGAGAFNQVYKVKVGDQLLARKSLRPVIKANAHDFRPGAVDLVYEAKLLNSLQHPHILKLHGVSHDVWTDCYVNGSSFCLYLDRLAGPALDERLEEWSHKEQGSATCSSKLMTRDTLGRLESIALPIAQAVAYLHEWNIVFRDLKPSNMGFDVHGVIQLYDFGMAREIHPSRPLRDRSGTILYMAPEVAQSQEYGLAADVYSYAMVLYELCTLQKPRVVFNKIGDSADQEEYDKVHFEKAVMGQERPPLRPEVFPADLQALLTKSWAHEADTRPRMDSLVRQLEDIVAQLDESLPAKSWLSSWTTAPSPLHKTRSRGSSTTTRSGGDGGSKRFLRLSRTRHSKPDAPPTVTPSPKSAARTKKPEPRRRVRMSVSNTWFSH